jgi:hypothetical protein
VRRYKASSGAKRSADLPTTSNWSKLDGYGELVAPRCSHLGCLRPRVQGIAAADDDAAAASALAGAAPKVPLQRDALA